MNTTIIQLKLVHVVIFFYQIVSNTMKTKNTTRPEKYHTAEKIPHGQKNTTRPKKIHTAEKIVETEVKLIHETHIHDCSLS